MSIVVCHFGTVTIEGYFHFERVVFLEKSYFRFRLLQHTIGDYFYKRQRRANSPVCFPSLNNFCWLRCKGR
jgi:hypothetical protein